jgi:hypothetical protein
MNLAVVESAPRREGVQLKDQPVGAVESAPRREGVQLKAEGSTSGCS